MNGVRIINTDTIQGFVITLNTISPFLLIGLVVVVYALIAYREYLLKMTKYTLDKGTVENTYLKILRQSENAMEINEDEGDLRVNKTVEEVKDDVLVVPAEIQHYSFLLNPIRLAVMKVLNEYYKYPSSDLRSMLNVSWGKYTPHINQLEKKGFIVTEDEFVDGNPRKILILEDAGRQKFVALEGILKGLMN